MNERHPYSSSPRKPMHNPSLSPISERSTSPQRENGGIVSTNDISSSELSTPEISLSTDLSTQMQPSKKYADATDDRNDTLNSLKVTSSSYVPSGAPQQRSSALGVAYTGNQITLVSQGCHPVAAPHGVLQFPDDADVGVSQGDPTTWVCICELGRCK